MRYRWYGILIAGGMAACASSPRPPAPSGVPDHFDENLDVIVRSVSHPCGADADTDLDGKIDVHYTYTYDDLGRSKQDVGVDLTGALYEQIDYTWDNAGNLVEERDNLAFTHFEIDSISVYDTLGRRTQFQELQYDNSTLRSRSTIDYSEFDELGHAAHGDELIEYLTPASASQTLTREYRDDDLGRRISLDVHFASGDLFQAWRHTYDDVARTVTTNLNEPVSLQNKPGFTDVFIDSYDADYHYISTHDVETDIGVPGDITTDTVNVWDGDRELSSTTMAMATDPSFSYGSSLTYKYQCASGRVDPPSSGVAPRAKPSRSPRTDRAARQ